MTAEGARYCLAMSRTELWNKGLSGLQDSIADHHKLSVADQNHRLLVLSFNHEFVVEGLDDGVVTNRGQSWKIQLRPGMSAFFPADGCPAPD